MSAPPPDDGCQVGYLGLTLGLTGSRAAEALLAGPFAELGFKKRAGGIFTADLADGVLGWVGLNTASEGAPRGQASVNPVVGVRHLVIEGVVCELAQWQPHPYRPPTVSTPIGYVMPERRLVTWRVDAEGPTDQLNGVVSAVSEHGMRFMRSNLELSAIREALDHGHGNSIEYRLPVVLALMGEHELARSELDRRTAALGHRRDPAAEALRQFAHAFAAWEASQTPPADR